MYPFRDVIGGEVKRGQTTLVPSTVDSAKATDTYGSLLSGETVMKVTIWSSSKADSHVVPWLIGKTFNDYIYDYISTYQPTFLRLLGVWLLFLILNKSKCCILCHVSSRSSAGVGIAVDISLPKDQLSLVNHSLDFLHWKLVCTATDFDSANVGRNSRIFATKVPYSS